MAENKPYIMFVFANTRNDLDLKTERSQLLDIMESGDINGKVDVSLPLDDPAAEAISARYRKIIQGNKNFSIFHFSGHANSKGFDLANGQKNAEDLADLFKDTSLKLVFLNACNTSGLVNILINELKVKAVIATTRQVDDSEAIKVAKEFYTNFIIGNATLENAFNQSRFVLKNKNSRPRASADEDEEMNGNEFSWQLYYTQSWILKSRITDWSTPEISLLSKDETVVENLIREKATKEKDLLGKLEKKRRILARLENGTDEYLDYRKDVDEAENELQLVANERKTLEAGLRNSTRNWIIQNRQSELENAIIKYMNYDVQHDRIAEVLSQRIYSAFLVQGNNESCLEILYRRLKNVHELNVENKEAIINYDSLIKVNNCWFEILRQLKEDDFSNVIRTTDDKMPNVDVLTENDKKALVEKLILGFYYNTPELESQNHIIIKVVCSKSSDDLTLQLIQDFWLPFIKYSIPLLKGKNTHKIVFVILDEGCELENDQGEYINKKENLYKSFRDAWQQDFGAYVLPAVTPLKFDEYKDWIRRFNLYRILDQSEYENIYQSARGEIKSTLRGIKNKTNMPISIFTDLNFNEPVINIPI